jgi:MFS family permease
MELLAFYKNSGEQMTLFKTLLDGSKSFKILPREVWFGWVSSAVEAYNMAIYSFIAPFLAQQLFRQTTARSAIFFSYSLIFIGCCFLYPAGAIYYGFIGDKQGRRKTCVYSTLGLAVATGMMGLLPLHFLGGSTWIYFLVLIGAQHFFQAANTTE